MGESGIGFVSGGSSGDPAGGLDEGVQDAVTAGSGFLDIRGFQRTADSLAGAFVGTHGEVKPPGAVVVPEVVVGVFAGDTDGEAKVIGVGSGHDDTFYSGGSHAPNDRGMRVRSRRTTRKIDSLGMGACVTFAEGLRCV